MNKKQNWFLIIIFLIMIFGMTGATLLKPASEFSEKENRALQQKPELSAEAVFGGQYAKDYEKYMTDQFIGRDSWISVKTAIERASLKQESNDIYFAEDGYLIEKHTGSFDTPLAESNIGHLSSFLEKAESRYGKGHVTATVVPNAVDILKDKLPPFASPYDEGEYLKKIEKSVPEGTWLDSRSVLMEHRDEEIYYKTDHHWKTLGAWYVYEAWAKQAGFASQSMQDFDIVTVSDEFLGTIESKVGGKTAKDSIQIFKPKQQLKYQLDYNRGMKVTDSIYDEEALKTKDKYSIFFGGNQPVVQARIENGSSRKLLVIKDSYAHCFLPFAFHDFSEVDFVDLRYFNESLAEFMENQDYTDVLFLYNASGFAEDPSLIRLEN